MSKVILTWSEEGSEEVLDEDFLKGGEVFTQVGAWLALLLGRNKVRYAALEAMAKSTKANATLEFEDYEEYEEVTLELEVFYSSLDSGEWVTRLVLAFVPSLGVEGLTFFSILGFRSRAWTFPQKFSFTRRLFFNGHMFDFYFWK